MAEETTPKDLEDKALPDKAEEAPAASPAAVEAMKVAPQAVKRSMPMGLSIAVGILLAGLLGWLAHYLVWFVLVLYLSFVAATIMEAPVHWLKRRGIRRGFAAVIVMVGALVVLVGVLYFVANGVYGQVNAVSANLVKAPDRINSMFNGIIHRLQGHERAGGEHAGAPAPPRSPAGQAATVAPAVPEAGAGTQPTASAPASAPATAAAIPDFNITQTIANSLPTLPTVWTNAMSVVEVVSWLVIMFFVVLYMLVDGADHLLALRTLLPKSSRLEATRLFNEIAQAHRGWALASLSNVASASTLIGLGLYMIGIPGAFLLGFVAGLGELIPNIGPVLGAVPAILLTALMEPDKFLYVLGMFVVAQTIQSYTISPMMLKFSIELPVLVTIISVLVFGILFGLLGILVAIPLVADMVVVWQYINKHMEKDTTDYDIVNASTEGPRAAVVAEDWGFRRMFRRSPRPDAREAGRVGGEAGKPGAGMARLDEAERRRAANEREAGGKGV